MEEITVVRERETLDMLSARLNRPGCMILRANGLFSPAWLLPGRELAVPPKDYCTRSAADFPCPVQALHTKARRGGVK